MKTKRIIGLFLAVLVLFFVVAGEAIGDGEWTPDNVEIVPENPTSADVVDITFSGEWPNSCIPVDSYIAVNGNEIYFGVISDWNDICSQEITHWELTEIAGHLSPGVYSVYASLDRGPWTLVTEFVVTATNAVYYVDADATGTGTGLSWANAYNYLKEALDATASGAEIRVAQGTYRPNDGVVGVGDERELTFQLKPNVTVKGGYAGFGEPDSNARDIELYETILSGDLLGNDVGGLEPNDPSRDDIGNDVGGLEPNEPSRDDNSYHVVTGSGTDETAVLDGFTITAGNANGSSSKENNRGGGVKGGSATLVNCTISWNSAGKSEFSSGDRGGGLKDCDGPITNCTITYNRARGRGGGLDACDGPITNCTIRGNSCVGWGGGLHWCGGAITNCTISNNSAGLEGGGLHSCNGEITNCVISGNSANNGGGMYNWGYPTLTNCTFTGNYGGGMYSYYSIATLTNCILWGNEGAEVSFGGDQPVVNYSCIQGGWTGVGNINVDPLFVDANGPDGIAGTEDDNLRLSADSLCIDAGNNSAVTVSTDLDGNPRIINGIVDMGAYEFYLGLICVDADATGANDGSCWADAYTSLPYALDVVSNGYEIRVAQGTYRPNDGVVGVGDERELTFQLKNDVTVKGGYAGYGEPDPNARDIELYETILSGDLLGNDVGGLEPNDPSRDDIGNDVGGLEPNDPSRDDNSYHVVTGSGTNARAILDGFTITGGNANYPDDDNPNSQGGGMYNDSGSPTVNNCAFIENSANSGGGLRNSNSSSPILTDCTFSGNLADEEGGGVRNYDSRPTLINCTFSGNIAGEGGGGMENSGSSSPTLVNCMFSGNSVEEGSGGGMCNSGGSPTIVNCTFSGNFADEEGSGGGMYNSGSCLTIVNCTFSGNTSAGDGGGVTIINYNGEDSSSTVTNCIFWANAPKQIYLNPDNAAVSVTYSDVQGGWEGMGNIDVDPLFVDPCDGDYHLKSEGWRWDKYWTHGTYWKCDYVTSPCIDAGNPGSPLADELLTIPDDPSHDWGVNLRINMGAYGGTTQAGMPPYGWALLGDLTNDGIVGLEDLAGQLEDWLENDSEQPGDLNRDGIVNMADFALLAQGWPEMTDWAQ